MKEKSSREKGDELEQYVARILNMEFTRGSGNQLDDADLKDDRMLIECKVKNGAKGVSIPGTQLNKLTKQAAKWRKEWALATMNSDGQVFFTVNADWFREIYDAAKEQWKNDRSNNDRGKQTDTEG